MFRNIAAIIVLISFIAMASSGLIMFFSDDRHLEDLVEAVHLTFGFFLIFGSLYHIFLNFKPLTQHFRKKSTNIVAFVLSLLLAFLYLAPILFGSKG